MSHVAEHYTVALDEIQRAQDSLDTALRALCSVVGGSTDYRRVMKARERVHALWYAVERASGKTSSKRMDGVHGTYGPCETCGYQADADPPPVTFHPQQKTT